MSGTINFNKEEKSMMVTRVENGYKVEAKGKLFIAKDWKLIDEDWINVSGAENPEQICCKVELKKAKNGFVVKVGCVEFVADTWNEVNKALQEYWDNPSKARRKYYKSEQELAELVDKVPPLQTYIEKEEEIGITENCTVRSKNDDEPF